MYEEVDVAARWWTNQLKKKVANNQPLLDAFRKALAKEMVAHYTGHWYESDRLRGSAYRSVSYDHRLDGLLRRAAKTCGIEQLEKLLAHTRYRIMFVNPREVKILNSALLSEKPKTIFRKDAPGDPAINITPSSSPTSAGGGTSSSGTGSPPESPSELSPPGSPPDSPSLSPASSPHHTPSATPLSGTPMSTPLRGAQLSSAPPLPLAALNGSGLTVTQLMEQNEENEATSPPSHPVPTPTGSSSVGPSLALAAAAAMGSSGSIPGGLMSSSSSSSTTGSLGGPATISRTASATSTTTTRSTGLKPNAAPFRGMT